MRGPRFTEAELREAVAAADSWAAALRLLGMRVAGGNHKTVQKWAARWSIPTDHFDPVAVRARTLRREPRALEEVLVAGSAYKRAHLKERLYREGLKTRACELCGQSELWNGKRMSLILDHINGDATDNRLENLRIACPNCAATFDTHCGRNKERRPDTRACSECREEFAPKYAQQMFCSIRCAKVSHGRAIGSKAHLQLVERPPYEQLLEEIARLGYSAVGRKYGVSDNAIRKWVRVYERERLRRAA